MKHRQRKSKGDGSVYLDQKTGRYIAQVRNGWYENGHAKYARKSFKTVTEAEQYRRELVMQIQSGTYREPLRLTVGEWAAQWLGEYKNNIKYSTRVRYQNDIDSHIVPRLGRIRLDALTYHDVQRWVNALSAGGMKPKTVKNVHNVLHGLLGKAVQLNMIARNAADVPPVELPRIEKTEVNALELEQQRKLLQSLGTDVYAAVIRFALFTGMRQGEILGLTWDCVNFERGEIEVKKQLLFPKTAGDGYEYGSPKGNRPRTIAPAAQVFELLRERRKQQNCDKLRNGPIWNEGDFPGLVFTRESGGCLNYQTVDRRFAKALEAAGVERHRFHDLRHTFAVNCTIARVDYKALSDTLGHHDVAFTLNRYGHFTSDLRRQAATIQSDFFDNVLCI